MSVCVRVGAALFALNNMQKENSEEICSGLLLIIILWLKITHGLLQKNDRVCVFAYVCGVFVCV